MTPVKFEESTHVLGAGDNPNTGDLHVAIAEDPDTKGPVMITSCWELSDEELAEVIRTRRVWIAVMANPQAPTQPPICSMAYNPFEHYGYMHAFGHKEGKP